MFGGIPESPLIDVGEIHEHAEPVALPYQLDAGVGQTRSGIRGAGALERHAVGVDIGSAPDDPQRAEADFEEPLQRTEVWRDCLGTLEVEDHRQDIVGQAPLDLGDGTDHVHRSVGLLLDVVQPRDDILGELVCVCGVEGRHPGRVRARGRVGVVRSRLVGLDRRDEDGEEPPGKSAAPRPGQIDVSDIAFDEEGATLPPFRDMEVYQSVVVAVEDGKTGCAHGACNLEHHPAFCGGPLLPILVVEGV